MTRREWGWVAALTALGLILRLIAIGDESAWMDEIYSFGMARSSFDELVSGTIRDRGNPVGYYLLLREWLQLFGSSVEAARVFSAITGALAIPLTAKFARNLSYPARVALIAAALVAVSPPLVYLGREARVFALASTVVMLHLVAASAIVQKNRLRDWALYTLSAAALLYLHYFSVFVLLATGAYLVIAHRRWPVLIAGLVAGALFVPYFDTLRWQVSTGMERSAETWWKHAVFMPAFAVVGHTLVWIEQGLAALAAVFAAAWLGVWTPVMWSLRARVPWFLIAAGVVPIVLAALFSFIAPLLIGRYAAMVFPVLAVLIALGWEHAVRRLRIGLGIALGILTLASLIGLYAGHHKDDWRAVGEALDGTRPIFVVPHEAARGVAFYRPELPVQVFDPRDAVTLTQRINESHDVYLVLYRYDPRVTADVERALSAWPGLDIEKLVTSRRLEVLHVIAP